MRENFFLVPGDSKKLLSPRSECATERHSIISRPKGDLTSIALQLDSISADHKLQSHVSNIAEILIVTLRTPVTGDHRNDLIILAMAEAVN